MSIHHNYRTKLIFFPKVLLNYLSSLRQKKLDDLIRYMRDDQYLGLICMAASQSGAIYIRMAPRDHLMALVTYGLNTTQNI